MIQNIPYNPGDPLSDVTVYLIGKRTALNILGEYRNQFPERCAMLEWQIAEAEGRQRAIFEALRS